jgi:beta propeller repeat protein
MINKHRNFLLMLSFLTLLILSIPGASGAPLTGTLTKISVGPPSSYEWEPAISGDYIVWSDERTGDKNIFLYNIATGVEQQLSSGPAYEERPAVSGHYVVWQDDRFILDGNGIDIVLHDLDTGISTRIANETGDQINPSIDGDLVVWQDGRNGAFTDNIYLYSISSATETQVSNTDGYQVFPRVSGNLVVWENDTFSESRVSMYDYAGAQTPFEPVAFNVGEVQARPSIQGNYLVWSDNHLDLTYSRIYRMDLSTHEIEDITPDDNDHFCPDTDGKRVVWIEYDDIFLNDTAVPASETQVTFTFGATIKDNLRISGDRIVWWETDGAFNSIYLFTLGSEETCPVADFTIQPSQSGAIPFTVTFTDISSNPAANPISHWHWNFGDGNHSPLQSPVWKYERPGNFDVSLTVDNLLCRNATDVGPGYRITAGAAPVPGITASPLSGLVPLTVTFTDTSSAATSWNWSFGDGTYAGTNPAIHMYTSGGKFKVILDDANEWGHSNTSTLIWALTGPNETAYTRIEGFVVENRFGGQFLVYNGTALPGYSMPSASILISPPLTGYGWQNITFRSNDSIRFYTFENKTIMGNLSGVVLESNDILPTSFSASIGPQSSIFYTMDLATYPVEGILNTQVWEGVIPKDDANVTYIAHQSGWDHVLGTAYTIKNTLTQFSPNGPVVLHFSVNSKWITKHEGRDYTYLVRIGDDDYGQVLPTRFLYNDPVKKLDYFEADSPRGLSTFVLTQLAGSGNPLQLITLTITSHVNPPEPVYDPASGMESDGPGGGARAGAITVPTATPTPAPATPVPPDPGTSAKIYTNANGLVTQATRLLSTNGRATITIGEGIVAKDAGGSPLTEITLKAILPENLPGIPTGSAFTFAGMAYDLGPDGATFSLPVALAFTLPQAEWGKDYSVKFFDQKSGTWQDLPTTFDAATGTVTANIGHLSVFALFSQPRASPVTTPAATPLPLPPAPQVQAQPPATAVSIFTNMMSWAADLVVNNAIIPVVVVILAILGYLAAQGRFPGGR